MKIVVISDAEERGGAGVAGARLAGAWAGAGHDVSYVVSRPSGSDSPWTTQVLERTRDDGKTLLWKALGAKGRVRERREAGTARSLDALLRTLAPDIVSVQNVHGGSGWSIRIVETAAVHAPVFWTLHDMWSFTGRCAYAYDCTKFAAGCDETCPTPDEYPALAPKRIHAAWARKQALLRDNDRVAAIAPSRWLHEASLRGGWPAKRLVHVEYGLDLETYAPVDREQARSRLKIPADRQVLLIVAPDLSDRRKGAHLLLEALGTLRDDGGAFPLCAGMGKGSLKLGDDEVALGFLSDEAAKRDAYNAADVVVHPALADNLPNVLLESLACGTPIVGFPAGGVPDIIADDGGWVASAVTSGALAASIRTALDEIAAGRDGREAARASAVRRFALPQQAHTYLDMFDRATGAVGSGA